VRASAPASRATPAQRRLQERFESLISLAAPALDLLLNVGDRISRAASGDDGSSYPAGSPEELELVAPSLRCRDGSPSDA
jgi:hypothetical protein